jgi:hypothetical protein
MKSLPLEGQRHLDAAQGWFELGNHLEANEELEQITAEYRAPPEVLEVRWCYFPFSRLRARLILVTKRS